MSKESALETTKKTKIDKEKLLSGIKEVAKDIALQNIEGNDFIKDDLAVYVTRELLKSVQGGDVENLLPSLQMIGLAKPRDSIELMLVLQMILVNNNMMLMSQVAKHYKAHASESSQYVNSITKLSRTFTGQMDALKKYQGKGQQKITVEHLNVNQGGRAVVGDVSVKSEEGGDGKKGRG